MSNNKKVGSLFLAMILILSVLCVPALAAGEHTDVAQLTMNDLTEETLKEVPAAGKDIEIPALTQGQKIQIVVPKGVYMVLNPYKMEFDTTKLSGEGTDDNQIIFRPQVIKNLSNTNIMTSVKATATLGQGATGVTIGQNEVTATTTTKSVFLYAELSLADDPELTGEDAAALFNTTKSSATALTYYNRNLKNQVAFTTAGQAMSGKVIMAAAELSGTDASDNDMYVPASENSCIYFKVDGNMTANPTTAWTTSDKVTAKLTFTFLPTGDDPGLKA